MADICIPQNIAGAGGIGGGQGADGQASSIADGHYATSYGIPVIKITTGMTADYTFRLTRDLQGTIPAQLQGTPDIYFLCLADGNHRNALFQVPMQYLGNGRVSLHLSPEEVDFRPGLHYAQIHCHQEGTAESHSDKKNRGALKHVFKCCLQIQKSFDGSHIECRQPVTVAEVRMQLYDTSGKQNTLLLDLQFSDVIIARCINRAVQDWNQMPPTLANRQTAASFPFPANLASGAAAHCLRMASYRYNRNQMQHNNAGLTYDDMNKGALYANLADKAMVDWKNWIIAKKSQLNMLECMGSITDAFLEGSEPWWR